MNIHLSTILLSLIIAVSLQSTGAGDAVKSLICLSDKSCNTTESSSEYMAHLSARWECIRHHGLNFAEKRCNRTTGPLVESYLFCAQKEESLVLCPEIFTNTLTELPPACVSVSTCTNDCRAALVDKLIDQTVPLSKTQL